MQLRNAPHDDAQLELFSAIFTDIAARDARESMEVPFLSLSKQPRFKPIIYAAKGVEVTVTGGAPYGIANIWDWDLIMWLLSQIRHALDRGERVSRKVKFHRHAFLKDVRRSHGGSQYRRLEEAIARLKNTTIVTTIRARTKRTVMFSWIEYAEVERDATGQMAQAVVVLPEWLFEAVSNNSLVLSLHRDYFLLTGGLQRWLYRFVRKGAGRNAGGWSWKMRTLHERSGSTQHFKYFAREVREIVMPGRLLDYEVRFAQREGETFLVAKRNDGRPMRLPDPPPTQEPTRTPTLRTTTYENAKLLAPGFDIYALERDWRESTRRRGYVLRDADRAFLAWCKTVGNAKVTGGVVSAARGTSCGQPRQRLGS